MEYAYPLEDGRRLTALQGINLTIRRGEFVALIGPNGSGKSTLARHFNGLLIPTKGQVWVDGLSTSDPHHLGAVRQRVGMVFQNPDNQLVASTVEEDAAFGPENLALPWQEIRQRVSEALEIVGLTEYRTHPPQWLSGGQKQRLAIAGVLATRPICIVLDEPTSMLDPPGQRQVLDTIRRLNVDEGITIVLITQSMDEAVLAERVLVMELGRIVADGPPWDVFGMTQYARSLLSPGDPLEAGRNGASPLQGLPFATEVALRLEAEGVPLPAGILTIEGLVRALSQCGSA